MINRDTEGLNSRDYGRVHDEKVPRQSPEEMVVSLADAYQTYARAWREVHAAIHTGVLTREKASELFVAWGAPAGIIEKM